MPVTEGQLAVRNEQQLLVVPGVELDQVQGEEIVKSEDPYLASDVYQNSFGVASFALGVPQPSRRPVVYEGEGAAGPYHGDGTNDPDPEVRDNPIKRAHFYQTDKGFAVVRTVIAPTEIASKLREDKFLGSAVIDKCCLDGTVPAELDEETTKMLDDASWLALPKEDRSYTKRGNPHTERITQRLQAATGSGYTLLREYPSWHSYRVYREVIEQIIQGCQATVANFEEILNLLAKDSPKLHDFEKQALGTGAIALLPEGTPGTE